MRAKTARMLVRLYPQAWRQRYGREFADLLESGPGGFRLTANVIWSALCEHLIPTHAGGRNQSFRASRFHSLCIHAPWAVFGLAPPLLLAAAYFIACLYLWIVWRIFLPGADTPFGIHWAGPPYALQNLSFQLGKFYYFGAPVLVAWTIALIAVRQRLKAIWPVIGMVLTAIMGGTAEIRASRSGVPSSFGHIRLDFFAFGPAAQSAYNVVFHALLILILAMLPYLFLRRLQNARSLSI
jgi:hypothetical protein